MNRKQRQRKLEHRKVHAGAPTAVTMALGRVHSQADKEGVRAPSPEYIEENMNRAGYLPDGNGSWRSMTPVERKRWLGRNA